MGRNRIRDDLLLAAYREMAREELREDEAHVWAEATAGDVADDTTGKEIAIGDTGQGRTGYPNEACQPSQASVYVPDL